MRLQKILNVQTQRDLFSELECKVASEKHIHFEADLTRAGDVILT